MKCAAPKIIVITGPDGLGKAALCNYVRNSLCELYGPDFAAVASIRDGVQYNRILLDQSEALSFFANLKGVTRTLFLFHCMSLAIDVARESKPTFVIVDSFWYKYAVVELAMNIPKKTVLAAAAGFDIPDLTFYLDPDIVACGMDGSDAGLSAKDISEPDAATAAAKFHEEQKRKGELWQEIARENGPWIHLDASCGIESLGQIILKKIICSNNLIKFPDDGIKTKSLWLLNQPSGPPVGEGSRID